MLRLQLLGSSLSSHWRRQSLLFWGYSCGCPYCRRKRQVRLRRVREKNAKVRPFFSRGNGVRAWGLGRRRVTTEYLGCRCSENPYAPPGAQSPSRRRGRNGRRCLGATTSLSVGERGAKGRVNRRGQRQLASLRVLIRSNESCIVKAGAVQIGTQTQQCTTSGTKASHREEPEHSKRQSNDV